MPEIRHARRAAVLQLGAVAPLAAMVASAPRLPPPGLMPAPPPMMTKKKGREARKQSNKPAEVGVDFRFACRLRFVIWDARSTAALTRLTTPDRALTIPPDRRTRWALATPPPRWPPPACGTCPWSPSSWTNSHVSGGCGAVQG